MRPVGFLDSEVAIAQRNGGYLKIKRGRFSRVRRARQSFNSRHKLVKRGRIGLAGQVFQFEARLIERELANVQVARVEHRKQADAGIGPPNAE